METILDVIKSAFHEELSPELIARIMEFEPNKLETLTDLGVCVKDYVRRATVPLKEDTKLVPYVPLYRAGRRESGQPVRGIAIRYNSEDFDDPSTADRAVDALQHHLLFCHSIAFDYQV